MIGNGTLIAPAYDDATRIVIEIHNTQPIELLEFTNSLTALAREHETILRQDRPDLDIDETRLLVMDIRKGSIILELLPALAPFISSIETANTAAEFVRNIGDAFNILKRPKGRLADPKTQRLKHLSDAVQAIASDSDGSMRIAARHQDGSIIQEIIITKGEAAEIVNNSQEQRREIEQRRDIIYNKVLMRLHQSSVEMLRIGRITSEKGIVEKIDETPRTLVYVSDVAGQMIKSEIRRPQGNPFQKGFIIDLDVETVGGQPRVYRVLDVHEIIDLDE